MAKFIDTQWNPSIGTELADVLNNSGIACSWGIQAASAGVTVMWVKDSKGLQSTKQEFNLWQLDMKFDGFWIRLGLSFGDTLESGITLLQAAVDSLTPQRPRVNVAGCYMSKLAENSSSGRSIRALSQDIGPSKWSAM